VRERDAWLALMRQALAEMPVTEECRAEFWRFFEAASGYLVSVDGGEVASEEMRVRWDAQKALDRTMTAIRRRDLEAARELMEGPGLREHLEANRGICQALMAELIRHGLAGYARERARREPDLIRESYNGRSLLHYAAAAGDAETVEELLRLGMSVELLDAGGHPPLYAATNGCVTGGEETVRTLLGWGADVNRVTGVQRVTALHMAARRGNASVARILLEAGADPSVRDKRGETPLERARNCRQKSVVELLAQEID
jgi:ankyrin repeat protein